MRQALDSLGALPLHADVQAQRKRLRELEERVRKMRQAHWDDDLAPKTETDSWLLSYLDLLTLLLVVFVVMLAVSGSQHSPAAEPSPSTTGEAPPSLDALPLLVNLVQSTAQLSQGAESRWGGAWHSLGSLALPQAPALPDFDHEPERLTASTTSLTELTQEPPYTPVPALAALALQVDGVNRVNRPRANDSAQSGSDATQSGDEFGDSGHATLPAVDHFAPNDDDASSFSWPDEPLEVVAPVIPSEDLPIRTRDAEPLAEAGPPALPPNLDLSLLGDDIDVIVKERSVSFRISNEILFALGQADLTDHGLTVLERVVNVLADTPYPITVEGHTDPVPIQNERFPSNWELSTYRATSVLRHLLESGIDAQRLRAVGYADTRPIADNNTRAGRSLNRRVELILETPPDSTRSNNLP